MLRLFKSNRKAKLEKEYQRKLEAARDAQRQGRMPLFANLSAEAETVRQHLDRLSDD